MVVPTEIIDFVYNLQSAYFQSLRDQFDYKFHAPALVLIILVLFSFGLLLSAAGAGTIEKDGVSSEPSNLADDNGVSSEPLNLPEFFRNLGAPEHPHEEAVMIPCNGLVLGNSEDSSFENDFARGKFVSLHRATYDSKLDRSGSYAFGDHFLGKKRLWEARVQLQFKVKPKISELFFGIELEGYVPMGIATKKAMKLVISLLKKAVGSQIYHTAGDDPAYVSGELELPAFVMPLIAFDQYIVTPPGEEPPKLSDPYIPYQGSSRYGRVAAYQEELNELEIDLGSTYTFCFWGISQWLDKLNWLVKLPPIPLSFNKFCGRPPVHVVIYRLKKDTQGEDRHLSKLKEYFFHVAFWCSKERPSSKRIQELLSPDLIKLGKTSLKARQNGTKASNKTAGIKWPCCTAR